ncbi:hypothetical protein GMA3_69 [Gordonia phage GMA3]|uniref:Uncharacterized protein n=1 Tax=Gordonia phage GMA3 TaxID=1647284 RepID=A0A0K0NKL2_9CAUD|nr:hypothetical protein AU105_gp069 [Gordonia phage GMA3]AKL88246.1 hypothetical protein GMA3_69 [Gordonia phage GMA3]
MREHQIKASGIVDIEVTREMVHPKTLHYRGKSALVHLDPYHFCGPFRRRVYKDKNWNNGRLFIMSYGCRVPLSMPLERQVYRAIDRETYFIEPPVTEEDEYNREAGRND